MENTQEYLDTQGGEFDADDILYPCNKLDDRYASACYYYHTTYIIKKTDSITESFNQCNQLNSPFVEKCYKGIGRQMSLNYLDNMKGFLAVCDKGSTEYEGYCLAGGLTLLADQIGMDTVFETCRIWEENVNFEACMNIAAEIGILYD